ncbi:MAG: hypothetical protein LKE37_06780 [Atopobiaceae bacterium]|jgi:hypothetical protein|nr:hypothetical protein [Atopobiaceae bacterium]
MLAYVMDVEERSTWLRTTPGASELAQPFFCTEAGEFYAREGFATTRSRKDSYLVFYSLGGTGLVMQGGREVELEQGHCPADGLQDATALPDRARTPALAPSLDARRRGRRAGHGGARRASAAHLARQAGRADSAASLLDACPRASRGPTSARAR